jgi:hypothetical protein
MQRFGGAGAYWDRPCRGPADREEKRGRYEPSITASPARSTTIEPIQNHGLMPNASSENNAIEATHRKPAARR